MRLRHIEVFHAVYVNGSVSAAARALNVSQPSVTKVLQHAESLLGFPLFARTHGRLVPTNDAHSLFAEVAEIQQRVQSLRLISHNLRHGQGGALRISALPSLGLGVIPDAVARFLKGHAGVAFDLQTVHHDEMVRKLYDREADLVVGYEVPRGAPVAHRTVGGGELVVMFREEAWPDAPDRIALSDIGDRPFISPVHSGPTGRLLAIELSRTGVLLNEVASTRTFYIATSLVKSGVGLTIVDSFTALATQAPGVTFRPMDPPLTFDVQAVYLQDHPPSALANAFLRDVSVTISAL